MAASTMQIGTTAKPLEVRWGVSDIDQSSASRAFKVYIDNPERSEQLRDMDDTLITSYEDSMVPRDVLRLKIWQNAKVTALYDPEEKLSVEDIERGDRICVKTTPYEWEYTDPEDGSTRSGVTLNVTHVLIVGKRAKVPDVQWA